MKKIIPLLVVLFIILVAFYLYTNWQVGGKPSLSVLQKTSTSSPTTTSKPQVIVENLDIPWALDFLPEGNIIFTERGGKIKVLKENDTATIATIEDVKHVGEGGLLGIAVHPNFEKNHYIYIYYTYSSTGQNTLNRVERYRLENDKLSDKTTVIDAIPGGLFHNGGRIKFGPDKYLYVTTGDAQEPSLSQNRNSLAGKILRVDTNGSVPPNNPFGTRVYSYGHRNPQGLAWDSKNQLWETEHGASATDEVNLIEEGQNYGWPTITGDAVKEGMITPIVNSGRSTWAPSGTAILKDTLFYAGLRGQGLFKYDLHQTSSPVKLFDGKFGRIREAVIGPDKQLYIFTNNRDGRGIPKMGDDKLIKIDPSTLL